MLTIPVEINESLNIHDLTHATVGGKGVFDVLMRAVKAHIQQEWDANRIKGNEYSTLYLGALQTVLQVSTQYVLSEAKSNAEVVNLVKQGELLTQQKLNTTEERAVIIANKLKADQEILFIEQKKLTEQANTSASVMGVGSLLDRQAKVLQAQADGFKRDAEQKASKIMLDAHNGRVVGNKATDPAAAKLAEQDVANVIAALKAGVGAVVTSARATASIAGGLVSSVSVDWPGTGYTNNPIVEFSGGGGSGAKASALISNGQVVSVSVSESGSGYTSNPTVTFVNG